MKDKNECERTKQEKPKKVRKRRKTKNKKDSKNTSRSANIDKTQTNLRHIRPTLKHPGVAINSLERE